MPKIHGSYQDRPYTIHLGENLLHDQALVSSTLARKQPLSLMLAYALTVKPLKNS